MPRWSDIVYFDTEPTETETDLGDIIITPGESRAVFANKKSVRQTEFYQAQANGLRPELMFEVRSIEYANESKLTYNDKTYSIIRVYENSSEITELVCSGIVNGV